MTLRHSPADVEGSRRFGSGVLHQQAGWPRAATLRRASPRAGMTSAGVLCLLGMAAGGVTPSGATHPQSFDRCGR